MARDISTTASSLAWGHGLAGVTVTDGAVTALKATAAADITVAADMQQIADTTAAAADMRTAEILTAAREHRIVAADDRMQDMRKHLITAAVVDMQAAVDISRYLN